MSVLVYVEATGGNIKKAGFEGVSYAKNTADQLGTTVTAVLFGTADAAQVAQLGEYGATKVLHAQGGGFDAFESNAFSDAVAAAVAQEGSKVIVFPFDNSGRALAPRLSARLGAGLVSGAIACPEVAGGTIKVKKNVFSGKAIANVVIATDVKIISFTPNSTGLVKSGGSASVEAFAPAVKNSHIRLVETKKQEGEIPLPEAELVVSAGRGMKGPENWGPIEELAKLLGAATACSRPVADIHWRPHHEHVGQTGIAIRPNLYIAVGISGAIQHLAGVNQSKVIVVINKDPEAPFFKAADYGVVGDAFDVLPRLIESVKKFKAGQN
jgi:electron transfer flavoprotein alpha subunit